MADGDGRWAPDRQTPAEPGQPPLGAPGRPTGRSFPEPPPFPPYPAPPPGNPPSASWGSGWVAPGYAAPRWPPPPPGYPFHPPPASFPAPSPAPTSGYPPPMPGMPPHHYYPAYPPAYPSYPSPAFAPPEPGGGGPLRTGPGSSARDRRDGASPYPPAGAYAPPYPAPVPGWPRGYVPTVPGPGAAPYLAWPPQGNPPAPAQPAKPEPRSPRQAPSSNHQRRSDAPPPGPSAPSTRPARLSISDLLETPSPAAAGSPPARDASPSASASASASASGDLPPHNTGAGSPEWSSANTCHWITNGALAFPPVPPLGAPPPAPTKCLRTFATPDELYAHLCTVHVGRKSTGNLSLRCWWDGCAHAGSQAGARFAKRDHVTSHARVHVGLKPWRCAACDKAFKRPQDLRKHERTHANDPPRTPERGSGSGRASGGRGYGSPVAPAAAGLQPYPGAAGSPVPPAAAGLQPYAPPYAAPAVGMGSPVPAAGALLPPYPGQGGGLLPPAPALQQPEQQQQRQSLLPSIEEMMRGRERDGEMRREK